MPADDIELLHARGVVRHDTIARFTTRWPRWIDMCSEICDQAARPRFAPLIKHLIKRDFTSPHPDPDRLDRTFRLAARASRKTDLTADGPRTLGRHRHPA